MYRPAEDAHVADGCDVDYVRYPALHRRASRPFNGHLCARALAVPLRAFMPDVVLAYEHCRTAMAAMRARRVRPAFRSSPAHAVPTCAYAMPSTAA